MSFKKGYKIIIMLVLMVTVYASKSTYAYGESDLDYTKFKPQKIESSINSGTIEVNANEENQDELDAKISTMGLADGYYTGSLYDIESMDLSKYCAMSFYISNDSGSPLKINMNITKDNGEVLSPKDDSKVFTRDENSDVFKGVNPYYGTIELPQGFKGNVYMPFNSFKDKDGGEAKNISRILSWGIIAALEKNEVKQFKLSEFSFVNKDSSIENYFNSNFSIQGDDTVQIPVAGEDFADYKIQGDNAGNVKFKLAEPAQGISISDEGRLTVTSDAGDQKIRIIAELNGRVGEVKDILLLKSWTLSAQEVDGTSKSIPKPEEMKKVLSDNDKSFTSGNFLMYLRIIIILFVAAFAILYRLWKKKK